MDDAGFFLIDVMRGEASVFSPKIDARRGSMPRKVIDASGYYRGSERRCTIAAENNARKRENEATNKANTIKLSNFFISEL